MWECKCGEMNPNSSVFCQSCGNNKVTSEYNKEKYQKQQRQEKINIVQRNLTSGNNPTQIAPDGYYEYKVLSISDENGFFSSASGRVDVEVMTNALNELGEEGWRLVTTYSNEAGRNAISGATGGMRLGINATVDENILIFERFIRFK